MFEIFGYEFFQRALIILSLSSIVAGVIGSLIVIKKISLISGSIAHGSFGGLGIAYYLGLNPLLGALIFSLFGAGIISYVRKLHKRSLDSILSIFWAGGMAVGIIFVFLTPGYSSDLFSYLFGNVLLSQFTDLYFLIPIGIVVVGVVYFLFESLVVTLFNEDFAKLKGIRTNIIYSIFLVLISLSVVLLIKTEGVILTLAILTISPTIALRFVNQVSKVIWFSITLNLITSILGLIFASIINLPVAPIIIAFQIVVFIVAFISKKDT